MSLDPRLLGLLGAVKDTPDDPVPRLVLADYFDDRDDAASADRPRAELLRLSARDPDDDPEAGRTAHQMADLADEHGATWLGPLKPSASKYRLERGFFMLNLIGPNLDDMPGDLFESEAWHWVETVNLHPLPSAQVAERMAGPRTLRIWPGTENRATAKQIADFLASAAASNVVRLDLAGLPLEGDLVRALERAALGDRLRSLELAGHALDYTEVEALLRLPSLSRLESLGLGFNPLAFSPEAIEALARLPGLVELDIRSVSLSQEVLDGLLSGPVLARLRLLRIDPLRSPDTERLLEALTRAGQLRTFAMALPEDFLTSTEGWQYRQTGDAILRSPQLPVLRSLDLNGFPLSSASLSSLGEAPHFASLRQLDLGYTWIGDAGLGVLIRTGILPRLTDLDLTGCDLTDNAVRALLPLAPLPRLRRLVLADNPLDYATIRDLKVDLSDTVIRSSFDSPPAFIS
jgi:uncharacterized protein (TIGR02996 family)